ncbi:hypothetical protein C0Q70_08738 [Pomacea canaliculata]|uniref:Uncharacterized protein n=1 Tax=Pomacea canaliculata TaxID=400727 RepID=A0A2T7P7T0_POMCA|nr:hypothetical protein C0Q70_08738 [Pomacea canaliculata]
MIGVYTLAAMKVEQHQSQINNMLHAMPSVADEEVKYSPIYGLVPDSEVATSPALRLLVNNAGFCKNALKNRFPKLKTYFTMS